MSLSFDTVMKWWRHGGENGDHPSPPAEGISTPRLDVPRSKPAPPPEPAWFKQYEQFDIPRTLNYPSTTLGRMLDQTVDRFGDNLAIVYNHTKRWTYRDLQAQVNRLAGGLAHLGVRRGERVILALPNCPEYVVSFFAIQKLGAIVVNAGPLMGADDVRSLISMTSPRVVIGLDLLSPMLTRAGHASTVDHWVWVTLQHYQNVFKRFGYQFKLWHEHERDETPDNSQQITLADLMEKAPARPPTIEPDPRHTAVLQPTGGTTGTLKVAQLSHENLIANATQVCIWMSNRLAQERVLAVLPMFHVYGLTTCLMTGILSASEIILMTRFNSVQVLEAMRQHRPTVFPLVPAICEAISNELERAEKPRTLEGLRLCISGAAPLPRAVAERFERLSGATVIEGYGLSEASPVTHANLPGHPRHGSIGLPLPDTQVRVVDLDTAEHDVAAGEPGEMLIAGPQIMGGYFGNAEQTKLVLHTDDQGVTWLHTGDVVRCDSDGYFYVLDRKKDMIIRSGLKVYPAKVEKVLMTHKQVKDAAVVGRPDPVHTEIVTAIIVPADGAESSEKMIEELRALCREHLAPYEVPANFEFTPALPRSPLGKLLRKNLRAPTACSLQRACPSENGNNGNGKEHP